MSEPHLHVVPDVTECAGFLTGLLLRITDGDRAALATLLELFYGLVRDAVAPQGHGTDDQVVEVFQEVWRRAPHFEVGQDPVAWVLAVAREAGVSPVTPVPAAS